MAINILGDIHLYEIAPSGRKDDYLNACLMKLHQVFYSSTSKINLSLGDIFHKPCVADSTKNKLLELIKDAEIELHICMGNHDIFKDNVETLPKTSLGNLVQHEAVKIMYPGELYDIDGFKVSVLPFHIEDAQNYKPDFHSDIMLGHHFYNWTRDPKQSLMPEHIEQLNTEFLVLGHDHEPHDPEQLVNTTILRPGSIMRTELKAYTLQHHPKYYVLEKEKGKISITEHIIPHEPANAIFKIQEKQDLKHCAKLMTEIKDLLDKTEITNNGKRGLRDILVSELNAPQDVVDYLALVHRVNRMEF